MITIFSDLTFWGLLILIFSVWIHSPSMEKDTQGKPTTPMCIDLSHVLGTFSQSWDFEPCNLCVKGTGTRTVNLQSIPISNEPQNLLSHIFFFPKQCV